MIKAGQKIILPKAKIILHSQIKAPFTFLGFIFLNQNNYQRGEVDPMILKHELAHIEQKHSLDIIFIELLHCVLWFNPILILYKRNIKLNHEFLADESVLTKQHSPKSYISLLLNQSSHSLQTSLENSFTYGEIKQRLIMMLKPTNKPIMIMKQVLIVPILLALIISFGQSKTIFQKVIPLDDNQRQEMVIPQTDIPKDILIELNMPDGGMMAYRKGISRNGKEMRRFVAGMSGRQKVRFLNTEGNEITKLAKNLTETERKRFWDLDVSKAQYQKIVPAKSVLQRRIWKHI